MQNEVTITHAQTGAGLPPAGIKANQTIYLAWDHAAFRLFVVQWDRVRWVCSCGRTGCLHKLAVNEYVFELSIKGKEA